MRWVHHLHLPTLIFQTEELEGKMCFCVKVVQPAISKVYQLASSQVCQLTVIKVWHLTTPRVCQLTTCKTQRNVYGQMA